MMREVLVVCIGDGSLVPLLVYLAGVLRSCKARCQVVSAVATCWQVAAGFEHHFDLGPVLSSAMALLCHMVLNISLNCKCYARTL
jgi:hypothetical protein